MSTMEGKLRAALDDAVDDSRLRETALKLAVQHLGKGVRYTTTPERITTLANAFYDFLKGGGR